MQTYQIIGELKDSRRSEKCQSKNRRQRKREEKRREIEFPQTTAEPFFKLFVCGKSIEEEQTSRRTTNNIRQNVFSKCRKETHGH